MYYSSYIYGSARGVIDPSLLLCLQLAGRLVVHWLISNGFSRDNLEVSALLQMVFSRFSSLACAYSHGITEACKVPQSLGLGLAPHQVHCMLLAKASHQAAQIPRAGKWALPLDKKILKSHSMGLKYRKLLKCFR